ncbi:hypothetical protein F9C28_12055 [Shimwellia pseudoproteus]|uniref:hypothetical protein n=1 Tax=Shimwellia pseudoproteus TaxID=570012 RepID=UPI0018EDBF12|nr:hypothetical protein [Shimwellia pseudoproteus]MBJ3815640.1 hypothetical protein [Shimwellia pseudoproteus]
MKYPVMFIAAALILFIVGSKADTQKTQWTLAMPYPNNPLKTASLPGEAHFHGQRGKAWLVLSCRPDALPARVTLRVERALLAGFPIEDFEGPGADGEHTPWVRVQGHTLEHGHAWTTTGAWHEQDFTWTITPTSHALHQWLHGKDDLITVVVSQAVTSKPPLTARFILPDNTHQAEQVIQPCTH